MLRLHWVAILWGRVKADLAITGGVHTAQNVLRAMMAGAGFGETLAGLLDAAGRFLYQSPPSHRETRRSTQPLSLQAQPPHGFLVRNAFAAVAPEPVAGFDDGLCFLFRLRLVVNRRVAQSGGHRIDDISAVRPTPRAASRAGGQSTDVRAGGDRSS